MFIHVLKAIKQYSTQSTDFKAGFSEIKDFLKSIGFKNNSFWSFLFVCNRDMLNVHSIRIQKFVGIFFEEGRERFDVREEIEQFDCVGVSRVISQTINK